MQEEDWCVTRVSPRPLCALLSCKPSENHNTHMGKCRESTEDCRQNKAMTAKFWQMRHLNASLLSQKLIIFPAMLLCCSCWLCRLTDYRNLFTISQQRTNSVGWGFLTGQQADSAKHLSSKSEALSSYPTKRAEPTQWIQHKTQEFNPHLCRW